MVDKKMARRLKKLSSEIPDSTIIFDTLRALGTQETPFADHSIAMIGVSTVEKGLEIAIRSCLKTENGDPEAKRIFSYDQQGPLSSFSSRIKMAFALDLIGPKTTSDLESIRHVRNAFAHSMNLITFETTEVAEFCRDLHINKTITILAQTIFDNTPRANFINCVVTIAQRLKNNLHEAKFRTVKTPMGFVQMRLLP